MLPKEEERDERTPPPEYDNIEEIGEHMKQDDLSWHEREVYLLERIRSILKRYSTEADRRKAFSRSCGTVQERLKLLETHKFEVSDLVILNRR